MNARVLGCAVAALVAGGIFGSAVAAEVNVYSARKDELIKPLLDAYTAQTGVKVNLLTADADQLIERLKSEGANSPADVLVTVDAGRLHRAEAEGLLQPVQSATLEQNVPAHLRDPENHWYGLSARARVIFYDPARVQDGELSTMEDLADPKWKGRICVRSSNNIYNLSMMAAMIATHGAEKAEAWAKGVAQNLARKPQGGDRDQIKAVAAGECDVAIANTYYYGGMLTGKDEAEKAAAEKVKVFFPNQKAQGTHVNVSGAGVTASSKNKEQAVQLIEFLSGDEAQKIYAEVNFEYPVKQGVAWHPVVQSWGEFKADSLNVGALGDHQAEAVKILDRVGWR